MKNARDVPRTSAIPRARGKAMENLVKAIATTNKIFPKPQTKPAKVAQLAPSKEMEVVNPPKTTESKSVQKIMLHA